MNNIEQYAELIAKHLAGEISPAEAQDLFAWVEADEANKKFFNDATAIWNLTPELQPLPFEPDFAKAWANIEAGTENIAAEPPSENNTSRIVPLSKIIGRWSVAAAVLVLLGVGLWWLNHLQEPPRFVKIETHNHEKKEIILPDSSRVWLNHNSSLVYREDFKQRHLILEGEAFFEVKRHVERPFEIKSGNATTTVLGTSFNVRAYPKEKAVEVTVKSGEVKLAATEKAQAAVFLTAGETGIFEKKTARVIEAGNEIPNADAWKTTRLHFSEALVKDIIQSLERYFDAEIQVSDPMILNCHYSANFEDPDLHAVMENLSFGLGLQMEKTDSGYLLSGKGCQPDN